DLAVRDADRYSDDLLVISAGQHLRSLRQGICKSFSEGCSSSSKPCNPETCERRASEPTEDTRSEILETNFNYTDVPFIFKGLTLPLHGLQFAWRLAISCWRSSVVYVLIVELHFCICQPGISSTENIARFISRYWMVAAHSWHACVEDGTARFLELLAGIRNGEHTLPSSFVYLLIPGLFSNHGPLYFVGTKKFFSKMGLACHIAKIHSEASVEHNALELKQYIEELYWGSGKRVMLLGHSKGGVDAAAALSIYWCDLKDKVAGLALVQSPYGGTPLASDILREGQIADKETRRIMELLICKLIKGDIRALEDLTYEKRKEFIMKHKLPYEQIPLVSFHSEASIAPDVLATMTHIAHAELPWLPIPNFGTQEESDEIVQAGRQLPVVIPLSAAMAVTALHLQLRYGEKSDGLVMCRDAQVPGSVVVAPDRKLDHAWMVYSTRKKNPSDANASEMCEAILTLLVELGKLKVRGKKLGN
ncbi:alpha/beta-Hydrolases superfamily protein, partial [Prunus dulcis]